MSDGQTSQSERSRLASPGLTSRSFRTRSIGSLRCVWCGPVDESSHRMGNYRRVCTDGLGRRTRRAAVFSAGLLLGGILGASLWKLHRSRGLSQRREWTFLEKLVRGFLIRLGKGKSAKPIGVSGASGEMEIQEKHFDLCALVAGAQQCCAPTGRSRGLGSCW